MKNIDINYKLGKLYYELFNEEYRGKKNADNLKNFAKNSLKYFIVMCNLYDGTMEILKYPILQLSNYLNIKQYKEYFENYNDFLYFPASPFINLPKDWKTNYSVNVIDFDDDFYGIQNALDEINYHSNLLAICNEFALNKYPLSEIYRFIYLSDYNPVIIILEKTKDGVNIFWKIIDEIGDYKFLEMYVNEAKTLSIKEWNDFEKLVDKTKFWTINSYDDNDEDCSDDTSWLIEGKKQGKYHIVQRYCGDEIKLLGLKLLELAGLKFDEEN